MGTEVLNNRNMENDMASEDLQNVVVDLRHNQGWMSPFQQSIRTYWLIKFLLAKAVMSTQEVAGSKLESILANIAQNI